MLTRARAFRGPQEIYYSIVKTPLRLSEPASMDVSEQCFLQLAQVSGTQRGLVLPSESGECWWRPGMRGITFMISKK